MNADENPYKAPQTIGDDFPSTSLWWIWRLSAVLAIAVVTALFASLIFN